MPHILRLGLLAQTDPGPSQTSTLQFVGLRTRSRVIEFEDFEGKGGLANPLSDGLLPTRFVDQHTYTFDTHVLAAASWRMNLFQCQFLFFRDT